MIRPLNSPLDLWLIFNLERKGEGFGPVSGNTGVWQRAFLSLVFLPLAEKHLATYVMQGKVRGFIQTRRDYGREGVEVIYLAPAPYRDGFSAAIWEALINYASWRLGSLGVKRLFADVPEGEEAFFRQAGFSVYAREFLYTINFFPESLPEPGNWQPIRPEETLNLVKIYQNLTPTPVQQKEGAFHLRKPGLFYRLMVEQKGLVLKEGADPIAFLIAWREKGNKWMKLFIHPSHQTKSPHIVGMSLAWARENFPPPFTFRVRSYEGALAKGLEEWGLPPQRSLSIMVRNTMAMGKALLRQIPAIP